MRNALPPPTPAPPQVTFQEPTPPDEPLIVRSQIVRIKESGDIGSKATVQVREGGAAAGQAGRGGGTFPSAPPGLGLGRKGRAAPGGPSWRRWLLGSRSRVGGWVGGWVGVRLPCCSAGAPPAPCT